MNDWKINTENFTVEDIPHNGNKFLCGNGYFGIRGTLEEYTKEQMCAINLAGIYDRVGEKWRESVNAPNVLYTILTVDGEAYTVLNREPVKHCQELDFHAGIHTRETVWKTEKGTVSIRCERFASMENQHIIAMKYSVKTDYDCEVEIITGIDGDVWDINGPHFARVECEEHDGIMQVTGITVEQAVSVISRAKVTVDFPVECTYEIREKQIFQHLKFRAIAGPEYSIEKTGTISTTKDESIFQKNASCELSDISYHDLKEAQIQFFSKIWENSAIEMKGDEEAEKALNYSIYHLNCIAPRNMKNISIPARGLSGQVYKGAIFWDTEMFMIDYFIYTEPEIARTLIQYRISTLPGARKKAEEYGLKGAYYAWESQEGGYEACSDFNVTDVFTGRKMRTYFRDKQYHVSAAIVYAIGKYLKATGDFSILAEGAMEVIIECAMFYRSLLMKKVDGSDYEICDVVGPDEYHERVDNNAYTNRMAKYVFETSDILLKKLKELDPVSYSGLCKKYNLDDFYIKAEDSACHIKLQEPDKESKLIEQFDGYFKLENVLVNDVRARIIEPSEYWGGAYGIASQTQVLKQADVVAMLSMFHGDYSQEVMEKNWNYYEPRTEHGSSLSACMYSLLACYIGKAEYAYPLFLKSARVDLVPGAKEWIGPQYIGGTHPASEGGAWIVAVNGFAGIFIENNALVCKPQLPENLEYIKLRLLFRGKRYQIMIRGNEKTIQEIKEERERI